MMMTGDLEWVEEQMTREKSAAIVMPLLKRMMQKASAKNWAGEFAEATQRVLCRKTCERRLRPA